MIVLDAIRPYVGVVRRQSYFYRMKFGRVSVGRVLAGRCGFFGNMFMTLNGIRLCEAAGVRAEPIWRETSLYYDPARGPNAWEYYFRQPPAPAGMPEAQASGEPFEFKPTANEIFPRYPGMGIRASYAECIRRFVRVRDDVQARLDDTARSLFGDSRVVGVHVRMTDTVAGVESRQSFALDRYCEAIDAYLATTPQAQVFVASDSALALEEMGRRYPNRVLALDCIRSADGKSIHGHYDEGVAGSPHQKGLDVLLDAYLLSRVHHLVRVSSRVTAYSLCLNPALTFTEVAAEEGPAPKPDDLPWLADSK